MQQLLMNPIIVRSSDLRVGVESQDLLVESFGNNFTNKKKKKINKTKTQRNGRRKTIICYHVGRPSYPNGSC